MPPTTALPEPAAALVAQVQATRLPPPAKRRAIRVAAGVSARAMARACDVTVMTLLKWEDGATPKPERAIVYGALLRALAEAVQ